MSPSPAASPDGLIGQYNRNAKRTILLIAVSAVGVLMAGLVFSVLGATGTTFGDVLASIRNFFSGAPLDAKQKVILYLRLPRIAMAVFAGAGLSVSGCAMQGITHNPLVSPFTIGISNAAAFGASMAIVFGFGIAARSELGVVLTAFLFAFLCAAVVYGISLHVGMSAESIVLTGIAVNYFFSAATSTIEYFADEHRLAAAVAWAFGSFNGAEWREVAVVSALVSACFLALLLTAPSLNALSCGNDEVARSIGVNPARVRVIVGACSVLAAAAVISFTGVIGFVGLAGPHIARMLIGADHRYLIPFSAVTGAALTLAADTIGRLILAPVLIPVGIVVSFLGVPIFVNLVLAKRKGAF